MTESDSTSMTSPDENIQSNDIGSRVSRLEADVANVARDVSKLADTVSTFIRSEKTNWPVIFSGVGIVVTLLGLGVTAAYFAFTQPQIQRNRALEQRYVELRADHSKLEDQIYKYNERVFGLAAKVGLVEAGSNENSHELDLMWDDHFKELEWRGRVNERIWNRESE